MRFKKNIIIAAIAMAIVCCITPAAEGGGPIVYSTARACLNSHPCLCDNEKTVFERIEVLEISIEASTDPGNFFCLEPGVYGIGYGPFMGYSVWCGGENPKQICFFRAGKNTGSDEGMRVLASLYAGRPNDRHENYVHTESILEFLDWCARNNKKICIHLACKDVDIEKLTPLAARGESLGMTFVANVESFSIAPASKLTPPAASGESLGITFVAHVESFSIALTRMRG
ncbi:MAG: hypothetical protein LBR79_02365 [Oscillospiraceae bacterium]|jgi:hypothetical protein|nr:hypothetical protein [Oscillospiraceae bacterium]